VCLSEPVKTQLEHKLQIANSLISTLIQSHDELATARKIVYVVVTFWFVYDGLIVCFESDHVGLPKCMWISYQSVQVLLRSVVVWL